MVMFGANIQNSQDYNLPNIRLVKEIYLPCSWSDDCWITK